MGLNTMLDMRSIAMRAERYIWDPRRLAQEGLREGDDVLSWPDEVAGLRLLTTTATGINPQFVGQDPEANGQPGVRFFGRTIGESYMDTESSFTWAQPITYVLVVKAEGDQGPPPQFNQPLVHVSSGVGPYLDLRDNGAGFHALGIYAGAGSTWTPAGLTDNTPVLLIARFKPGASNFRAQGTTITYNDARDVGSDGVTSAAIRFFNTATPGVSPFRGVALYLAVFHTELSGYEVSQIEQTLLARFGIAGTVGNAIPSPVNSVNYNRRIWFSY